MDEGPECQGIGREVGRKSFLSRKLIFVSGKYWPLYNSSSKMLFEKTPAHLTPEQKEKWLEDFWWLILVVDLRRGDACVARCGLDNYSIFQLRDQCRHQMECGDL